MEDDLERKIEKLAEEFKRRARNQIAGGDPDSFVRVPLKPRPSRDSGAVTLPLPEPEENAAEATNQTVFFSGDL
jgi:hypothetical protein